MPLELLLPTASAAIERIQQQSTYKGAGNTDIIPLGRQNVYRELSLRLQATFTLTGGNNTVANTKKGDEWAMISRVRLVANATDVLVDLAGDDLWWLNYFEMGAKPSIGLSATQTLTLGDGATANASIDSTLIIPIWAYRTRKPMETAYESHRVANLQLEITYQDATAVNANAVYSATPVVEIGSSEVEPTDLFIPPFVPRIYKTVTDFAAAQTTGRIPLDVGPFYRGMIFNVSTNGGGDDIVNTCSRVKVVAGSTVLRDLTWNSLLQTGRTPYGIPNNAEQASPYASGVQYLSRSRVSAGSDWRSWTHLNICKDGYLSEAFRSPTANDIYLEVTSSAAMRFSVIAFQLFPNPFKPSGQA